MLVQKHYQSQERDSSLSFSLTGSRQEWKNTISIKYICQGSRL